VRFIDVLSMLHISGRDNIENIKSSDLISAFYI